MSDLISDLKKQYGIGEQKKQSTGAKQSEIDALHEVSGELGINPVDLATIIGYETAGTYDPWKAGPVTKWGQHRGLIQFGEPQRKEYGVFEGQSFEDQLRGPVKKYLLKQFEKSKRSIKGAKAMDLYSAVLAGGVGDEFYDRSDGFVTPRSAVSSKRFAEHRKAALDRFFGGAEPVAGNQLSSFDYNSAISGILGKRPVTNPADERAPLAPTNLPIYDKQGNPVRAIGGEELPNYQDSVQTLSENGSNTTSETTPETEPFPMLAGNVPRQPELPAELQLGSGEKWQRNERGNYQNPDGDEFAVTQEGDRFLPKPVTPFTKKLRLTDGTVLTRDDESAPTKGKNYRDDQGNVFTFDGENIIGKQTDLKNNQNYQEYLSAAGLTDSPATQAEYNKIVNLTNKNAELENRRESRVRQNGQVQQQATQKAAAQVPETAYTELPNVSRSVKVIKNKEDLLKSQAGSVGVDLAQKPKGMKTSEYLLRSAYKALQSRFGYSDAAIDNLIANRPYLTDDDGYWNRITDANLKQEVEALKKQKGNSVIRFSLNRRAIADLFGGAESGVPQKIIDDYKQQQEQADFDNSLRDPLKINDKSSDNLTGQFYRDDRRQKILSEPEAEKQTRAEIENAVNNPSAKEVVTKGVSKGFNLGINPIGFLIDEVKNAWNGNFGAYRTNEAKQKEVESRIADIEKKFGSFADYRETVKYAENMSAPETAGRMLATYLRSAVNTAISSNLKGLDLVDTLLEKINLSSYVLPDKLAPSLRNLENLLGYTIASIQGNGDKFIGTRKDDDVDKRLLYSIGENIEKSLGDDKYLRESVLGKVSEGLGSASGFMLIGFLAPQANIGKGLAQFGVMSGASGALSSAGSMYSEAKQKGLAEKDAQIAGLIGIPIGATEGFGVGAALGRFLESTEKQTFLRLLMDYYKTKNGRAEFLRAARSRVTQIGKDLAPEIIEESAQETLQGTAEKSFWTFLEEKDKNLYRRVRTVLEKLPDAAAKSFVEDGTIAGFTGGIFGAPKAFSGFRSKIDNSISFDNYDASRQTIDNAVRATDDALATAGIQTKAQAVQSPIARRDQVNRLAALGYSPAQIDAIPASDASIIIQNAVSPQDFAELLDNIEMPQPERPVTIKAQYDAMLNRPNDTAIAVLFPSGTNVPDPRYSFIREISTPQGVLHVSMPKLKAWWNKLNPGEEFNYESVLADIENGKVPVNDLIGGKAADFTGNTAGGTAVVTVDENGNELNATKISDSEPENLTAEEQRLVQKQEKLDKKRFGLKAAKTGVTTSDEVVKARRENRPITLEEKFARLAQAEAQGFNLNPRKASDIEVGDSLPDPQIPSGKSDVLSDDSLAMQSAILSEKSESATDAAHEAATSPKNDLPEPTQAQKEAGNYKKGHISINGLDVTVENPVGSMRKGKGWQVEMKSHYGYIKRSIGADDEQIDVFVKDGTPQDFSGDVYIVDQINEDGSFDEHKAMVGYSSESEARAAYSENYTKDWKVGPVTVLSFEDFKKWTRDDHQKAPLSESATNEAEKPAPEEKADREFSSTQVNVAPEQAEKIKKFARVLIDKADIYDAEGFEDDIHITAKFGLHTNNPTKVASLVKGFGSVSATLGKTAIFDSNPDFDVVYVSVNSPDLQRLNKLISDNTENTDSHPEYKPHLTLAYVNKGAGKKYVGNSRFDGTKLDFDSLTFSGKDRKLTELTFVEKSRKFHEGDKVKLGDKFVQVVKPGDDINTVRNMVTGETYVTKQELTPLTPQQLFEFHSSGIENWKPQVEIETRASAARAALPNDEFSNPIAIDASQTEKVKALYALSKENIPVVEAIIDEIEKRLGLEGKWSAKEPDTIIRKANRPSILAEKPYHDVEHVRDSLRFKVRLQNFSDVVTIAEILKEKGVEIIKLDTQKMTSPKEWGWRFVAFDLKMPNGQLVEFYAPPSELDQKSVKGPNHVLFEKWRNATEKEKTARLDEYNHDVIESYNRYTKAYLEAIERMGYASEEKAAASWDNLTASLLSNSGSKESLSSSAEGTRRTQSPSGSRSRPTDAPVSSVQTNARPDSRSTETLGLSEIKGITSETSITQTDSESEKILNSGKEKSKVKTDGQQQQTSGNRDIQSSETAGTSGNVSSGASADGVLAETNAGIPEKSRKRREESRSDSPGSILSPLQPVDRAGDESAGSQTDGGKGGVASSDSGNGSTDSQNRPQKSTNGDADRVVGTTGNYYVFDIQSFASGGLKTKFRNNVAAIETLRKIQREGRETATPEEQAILAKYIGWGQFPALFNTYNDAGKAWDKERETLLNLISREEFEAASSSTKNAHYTAPQIVSTVWEVVEKLGFKGGRVVETSMGIGNFLYLMPPNLRPRARVTGIELDSLTAQIAKLLFPSYDIRQMGYQEFAPPKGYYDLAISNVPFGRYRVNDPKMPDFLKNRIHNYFFAKSLENVRPGGLIAFITSTGTLDSSPDVLKYLADKADLVTAIRFPANTFLKDAGTAVVTDLIVLRVKNPQLVPNLAKQLEQYEQTAKEYEEQLKEIAREEAQAAEDARSEVLIRQARIELAKNNLDKEIARVRALLKEADQFSSNLWTEIKTVPDPAGGEPIPLNEFYVANPKNILGELNRTGTMYRGDSVNVSATPDFEDLLKTAIERMPRSAMLERESEAAEMPKLEPAPDSMRQGSLTVKDGKIYSREGSFLKERAVSEKNFKNISAVLKVRELLNETAAFERAGEVKSADAARAELGKVYDAYVSKYGSIHENRKLIEIDPDHYRLLALEIWDKKAKKVVGKSDIFVKPTISALTRAETAENYSDALNIVLNQTGFVDLKEIARLMNTDAETAGAALVKEGLAFNDPRDGWTVKDLYLSGEVRRKLREAREAAALDREFNVNVSELEKVQPADIPYRRIEPTLGAAWIPNTDIKQFMAEMMTEAGEPMSADNFDVERLGSGDWVVGFKNKNKAKSSASNTILGTANRNFAEIVAAAIRDMPIVISYKTKEGTIVDKKASLVANKKVKEIRKKFKKWVWMDDARRTRLHRAFNDTYNVTTETDWNGAHLTFPGMSELWRSAVRPHIKNAVYRLLIQGKLLAAHEVGTGKTNLMIAAAMELRRLKLAKKPVIACLNANVEQVAEAARELYPDAKILAAYQGMDAKTRKETTTRIMSGDWDIVILTHENLLAMPMSRERQVAFMREEVEFLRQQVREYVATLSQDEKTKLSDNRVVKALEAKISNKLAKLEELFAKPKDDAITFEETGIDFLMVDEAHMFKNLDIYTTREGTKGIPTSNADRATNLYLVSRYLAETQNGRGMAFFTGTPISNTTAEAFNMQRYLQYNELKARGIHTFDAWAANYGENISTQEMSASGQYKSVTAFRRFKNLETLSQMMRQVMDVVWAKDVGEIVRPQRIDNVIAVPMSDAQKSYLDGLQERAEALQHMTREERRAKGADNWLAIGSDAKKMAIDMRLVDAGAADDPNSKTNKLVSEVLRIQRENPGKTQLIFSNIGINGTKVNPTFSLYRDIINKLVAGGIPRHKIIDFSKFTSGRKSDENDTGDSPGKEEAMRRLNTGEAWIAIGSAEKLGTGVNVQKKVIAMHKLDVKQRPDQDEQEIGRGHRHGNENTHVYLNRYTTEDSFDMFFYDRLKQKKAFIDQILRGEVKGEFIDSVDESLDYDTVVAVTASNPLIRERVETMKELQNLEDDFEAFTEDQLRLRDRRARLVRDIQLNERRIAEIIENREAAIKHNDNRTAKVGGMNFSIETVDEIRQRFAEEQKITDEMLERVSAAFPEGVPEDVAETAKQDIKQLIDAMPEMNWQKSQAAITSHIRSVKDEMKRTRYAGYGRSKFSEIIYQNDGRYNLGEIFGFPLAVNFEVDSKDNILSQLFMEFPSGSSKRLSVTETIIRAYEELFRAQSETTAKYDMENERYRSEIPQLERARTLEFEQSERLEELRRKLARIELELGGDVVPEGYQDITARMSELLDKEVFDQVKTSEPKTGYASGFGKYLAENQIVVLGNKLPETEETVSDAVNNNVQKRLDDGENFVKKYAKKDMVFVHPFLVETETDHVLFDNQQSLPAASFYYIHSNYPDAEFMARADKNLIYATENNKLVAIIQPFTNRLSYGEDLIPAMRRAKYSAMWNKDKKMRPFKPILKALQKYIENQARAGLESVIANNINLRPRVAGAEPFALFKILDSNLSETDQMTLSEMLDLPFVPFDQLLTGARAEMVGTNIKANAKAHEIFRRALEEIRLRESRGARPKAESIFGGVFLKPETVEKLITLFDEKAMEAAKLGYSSSEIGELENFGKVLRESSRSNETAIVFIFEKNLPHEIFHQAEFLGALEKSILSRHTAEGAAELDAHPLARIMGEKVFTSDQYTRFGANMRRAQLRSEILPTVLEMSDEEKQSLGISEEMIDDYQLLWFEDYALRNDRRDRQGNRIVGSSLENFEREELNVYETLAKVKSRAAENGGNRAGNENRDSVTGAAQGKTPTDAKNPARSGIDRDTGSDEQRQPLKEKYASLPATMRAAGIDAPDFLYEVFGDRAAVESAKKILDEKGFDGAVDYLRETKNADVDEAVLSFMLIRGLLEQAAAVEKLDPARAAELRDSAQVLAEEHTLKSIKAGRFTRAAAVIGQTVESVIVSAQARVKKNSGQDKSLSPSELARIENAARQTESALERVAQLTREKANLNRKIKRLEDRLQGKKKKRQTRNRSLRKALVEKVKEEKQSNIDKIRARLQAKFARAAEPADGKSAIEPLALFAQIAPVGFSDQDIRDFAEIGAMYLTEGLAKDFDYLPDHFKAEMIADYGDIFGADFDRIYNQSLILRDEWLRELRKDKSYEAIRNANDEDLTDEEIEEILGERRAQAARRRAIEEIHRLTAGARRAVNNERLYEIIEESDDDNAVQAAVLINDKISDRAIYKSLSAAGMDQQTREKALIDGSKLLKEAKRRLALERENLSNSLLAKQKERKKIDEMRFKARLASLQAQAALANELKRLETGAAKFYAGQAWNATNALRTLMASLDLSAGLRQGGFFAFSAPEEQRAAFAAMFTSFSENGYGANMQAIENHARFTLAQKSGIDFAFAGKTENDIQHGEELYRGDEFIEKLEMFLSRGRGTLLTKFITKPSERTYTAFLDMQRMVMFDIFADELIDAGFDPRRDEHEFKKIADFINIATGRGTIPSSKFGKVLINLPLFAPRYTLSRLQLLGTTTKAMTQEAGLIILNPVSYWSMPANSRRIIAKKAARFYGTTGAILGLASLFGAITGLAAVNWDDDDDDFLKITVGNTKYDILAGTLQPAKVLIKLMRSAIRTKGGFDNRVPGEIGWDAAANVARFLRGKLSPVTSLVVDFAVGEDYNRNEFEWWKAIYSRLIPLTISDAVEAYKLDGKVGVAKTIPAFFGLGTNTYKPKQEKAETEAEKLANKMQFFKPKPRTPEDKKKLELLDALTARARAGEDVSAEARAAFKAGTISEDEKKRVLKAKTLSFLEQKAQKLDENQLKTLLEVATPEEQTQLEKILADKTDRRATREAPKSLDERLTRSDTDKAVELWNDTNEDMTPVQKLEFKRRLREKAMSAARRGTLTPEELQNLKTVLPDLKIEARPVRQKEKRESSTLKDFY